MVNVVFVWGSGLLLLRVRNWETVLGLIKATREANMPAGL